MRTCRRCMLPSDATPAHDTPHANARALWHVLTKYPWQDCADEDGEADDRHQHVLHQHFHHPGAERLQTFLNNMQVEITVTFFESFNDGDMNVENIGSSSRHQRNSAQHSFLAAFPHTRSMPALCSPARQRVPVWRGPWCAHRRETLALVQLARAPLARSFSHSSLSYV